MESNKIKSAGLQPKDIVKIWIAIAIVVYLFTAIVVGRVIDLFTHTSMYGEYYDMFASDILFVPGFLVFLICMIVHELIYFYKHKRNKSVISFIVLLIFILGVTYKIVEYSETYKDYKDLHYAIEGTYCEDVQSLENIYIDKIQGRYSSRAMYIETSNFKFLVHDNIAQKEDFNEFKEKFNNVKKVKIRYLPNSRTLLSIEPMT